MLELPQQLHSWHLNRDLLASQPMGCSARHATKELTCVRGCTAQVTLHKPDLTIDETATKHAKLVARLNQLCFQGASDESEQEGEFVVVKAAPSYLVIKTLLISEFGDDAFTACKPLVVHTLETARGDGGAHASARRSTTGSGSGMGTGMGTGTGTGMGTETGAEQGVVAGKDRQGRAYHVAPVQLSSHFATLASCTDTASATNERPRPPPFVGG